LPAIKLSVGGSSPYTSTDKINKNKYKNKAVPLEAWSGPEGSRK